MRGLPLSSVAPHTAKDCGLIASFNKIRDGHGFLPLALSEGYYETAPKKRPVTVEKLHLQMEKECKEMRSLIGTLTKRVEALELGKGKKRKGTPASKPADAPATKKAKASSTAGKQSTGAASQAASGTGKKAKGKKSTPNKGKGKSTGAASGASIVEVSD
jgi:hypothetical protein